MHDLVPFFGWRAFYKADEDPNSPFYGQEYSEFEFTNRVYNYLLHPQWDQIGSETLLLKVLFVDYDEGYSIIELIGEWNDCLHNDIMYLKRELLDEMIDLGVNKFIFLAENVMNFHASDDSYYEELSQEVEDGWSTILHLRPHVLEEMIEYGIANYVQLVEDEMFAFDWRSKKPEHLYAQVCLSLPKLLAQ